MKKIMTILASVLFIVPFVYADDKVFEFNKLPLAAKEFVLKYFPEDQVMLTTVDDDMVRPDYEVVLKSGAKMTFEHNGTLDKVEVRTGAVPAGVVPQQIETYVKSNYPDSQILEYEIGKKEYEVKLSNRIELTFNSAFKLVGIDD